jgi:hypothetical protein
MKFKNDRTIYSLAELLLPIDAAFEFQYRKYCRLSNSLFANKGQQNQTAKRRWMQHTEGLGTAAVFPNDPAF